MRLTECVFRGVSYVERNREDVPSNLVHQARLATPRALYDGCVTHVGTAGVGADVHVPNGSNEIELMFADEWRAPALEYGW